MEALVKRLQIEVQSELDVVNPFENPVKGYDKKMELVKYAILELKHYLDVHSFPDKATEIQFFKHWLPTFLKLYIYFTVLYDLECTRITRDAEFFSFYLENEKKRIAAFLAEHGELYLYYMLGKSDKDALLFLRTPLPETREFVVREENFCRDSLILSELLAYEEYKKVLKEEIGAASAQQATNSDSKLKYIGTKAEAVEFITLIYEAKLFDNSMEQLIESFERNTGIDLKDFTTIDNSNRARKKSVHPLLDKFNQAAKSRINRLNP